MKLKTWLKAGRGRTVDLAKHLNVTKSMVSQMADETSSTPIPPAMYRRIKAFTAGQVDFEDMIPQDPQGGSAAMESTPDESRKRSADSQSASRELRGSKPDRRVAQVPIGFPDQRGTKPDRRVQGAKQEG